MALELITAVDACTRWDDMAGGTGRFDIAEA
jgi:hypothetical protein